MIDSTIVRAHQASHDRKRGSRHEAMGHSRGGLTTKVHMLINGTGCPVKFTLTGGEVSDFVEAEPLLEGLKTTHILADKGYDSNRIVACIEALGAKAVIPPKSNRIIQRKYDREIYKERNLIERAFNKLKYFRRIATRYHRKPLYFSAFLHLASAVTWG